MLYKRKDEKTLDPELFRAPSSEYRGAPFWAWNTKLQKDELLRQLDVLKEMGFGGAHMHVRTGMGTPYLSDEYMDLVRTCVNKCRADGQHAYLYDEDRWPSGAAGGLVTKDPAYRARYLLFTPYPYGSGEGGILSGGGRADAERNENGKLLSCFDIELDENGKLKSSRVLSEDEPASHRKWWAYLELSAPSPWYNNQTYVNTLDKKSIERFIEVTHERYKECVSDEFDKTVPSIFTDEPQFTRKKTLKYADELRDTALPWTDDLPETFEKAYHEDLISGIPELFWDRADGKASVIRYHYHDHICERFTNAFADTIGAWCRANGLKLTGHMMEEPTLESQTAALGEAMRAYRGFDIPGIDMLCARFEYTTAKQAQSAVHQFGYEGMLCEIYGVTNWDFDFRGHKLHGDWQAALGVTLRVPHLSWVSMAGEAKRDYPASISYQSPWWKEYSRIEDHFARVNTAMTRGTPLVNIGVIHPVESYWLHWGPAESTALTRDSMDQSFQRLTEELLFGSVDFNFISESLLPEQCPMEKLLALSGGDPSRSDCTDHACSGAVLPVGSMKYRTVIVPGLETIRSSTLDRLEAFRDAGGKLIFLAPVPVLVDAVESDRAKKLAERSLVISNERGAILSALSEDRLVELRNETGMLTENLLYQLRADGPDRWLFIAHGKEPYSKDVSRLQDVLIRVSGSWNAMLYDTMTGETATIDAVIKNGKTEITKRMYDYDSLLLRLTPAEVSGAGSGTGDAGSAAADTAERSTSPTASPSFHTLPVPALVSYTLSEPNALLLDQAEFALDDGEYEPSEEILRLDNVLRDRLGWPGRKNSVAQPWVIPEEPPVHTAHLRFHIRSEIMLPAVTLALEDAERVRIIWNGTDVPSTVTGYYVDRDIKTVALPGIRQGENILELAIPLGQRTNVEWCYLLGDFGVTVHGRDVRITALPEKLGFSDITVQGLPFYGGNLTYHIPVASAGGRITVRSSRYRGVLQTVSVEKNAASETASADGSSASKSASAGPGSGLPLFLPPYTASLGTLPAGTHELALTLFGHRRNGFGPVHLADLKETWIGPDAWRSTGDRWCYDYCIAEEGILATPEIREYQD